MAFNKNRVMEGARRYVEKGQTDKAIKEYLRVVKEDPNDVRVWLKIGDLYAKKGAKAEAVDTYLKVAKFYSEQGFYLKAVAVYKQILKLDARLIEVNLKLAELYRQLGLMSDAMRHFESVAGHFHREGKTKEALATVRQLVELDPENVATRIKLAELYSKEGMVEEAVAEFTRACEHLRANNRQDDFVKVAERLLWHKPDNTELNRELAGLYLRRNDPRRALQKLQICFKANPRDVETLAFLAQAFQALEQKSKTVQVLKELARVLDEDGKRDRAKDVHRRILAFVPADPDSLAYVGQASAARPVEAPPPAPPAAESPVRVLASQDVAPRRRHNPTGSMPLLDARAIPTVGYSTPRPAAPAFSSEFTEDSSIDGSAEAERHSDEIAKLLTETEVYVKYGLYPKAIEHLRRVFDLDAANVDARERLKDILLSQNRDREAMAELMRLAEITASYDPQRATGYLREVLAIEGTHPPAFQLAERFQLDLTGRDPGDLAHASPRGGGVVPVEEDIDFADIILDEDDEILVSADDDEEKTRLGNVDAAPLDDFESYEFELDDPAVEVVAEGMGAAMPPARAPQAGYEDGDFLGDPEPTFDPEAAAAFDAEPGYAPLDTPGYPGYQAPGAGHEQADTPEPGHTAEYDALPYEAFDGEPAPTSEYSALAPEVIATAEYDVHGVDAEPLFDLGEFAVDFELPSEQRATQDLGGSSHAAPGGDFDDKTRVGHGTVDTSVDHLHGRLVNAAAPPTIDSPLDNVEDELDEVDFFVAQGLYDAARDVIHTLLTRHPEHPLIIAKLQDIDALDGRDGDATTATAVDDLDFDEIENFDEFEPLTTTTGEVPSRPSVLLENPLEDNDADTHYDLGLAYKEMGLYDEAINAFAKGTEAPGREVQSRLMIGLCYREQNQLTEAIQQFKAALHAPAIVEREQLSLYYEIASSYEAVGDPKEALYFYSMIRKKDPRYRDVAERMAAISSGAARRGHRAAPEDTDAAIDGLLIESDGRGRRG